MDSSPASSPYRVGSWTVTKLKAELKLRDSPTHGTKEELIQRLGHLDGLTDSHYHEYSKWNVVALKEELRSFGLSPKGKKAELVDRLVECAHSSPIKRSPTKSDASKNDFKNFSLFRAKSLSPSKPIAPKRLFSANNPSNPNCSRLSTFTQIGLFTRYFLDQALMSAEWLINNVWSKFGFALLLLSFFILILPDKPPLLKAAVQSVLWHGFWFWQGAVSALCVGPSADTFFTIATPFIARVTAVANVCGTVDFPVYGPEAFKCPSRDVPIALPKILAKVYFEVFYWALGGAVANLLYYALGRSASTPSNQSTFLRRYPSLLLLSGVFPSFLGEFGAIGAAFAGISAKRFFWIDFVGRTFSGLLRAFCIILALSTDKLVPLLKGLKQSYPVVGSYLTSAAVSYRLILASRTSPTARFEFGWSFVIVFVVLLVIRQCVLRGALAYQAKLVKKAKH